VLTRGPLSRNSVPLADASGVWVAASSVSHSVSLVTETMTVRSIPLSSVLGSIGSVAPMIQIGEPTSSAVKCILPATSVTVVPDIVQVDTTPILTSAKSICVFGRLMKV
jgi:hypothetical protein